VASAAAKQDLTRGSIPRHLLRLAGPASASALLHNLYALNDLFFAGQFLGRDAQAAIASSIFVAILTFAFVTMVSAGALAVVSRLSGAGAEDGEIASEASHALSLGVLVGIVVGAIGVPLARPIMELMAPGLPGVTAEGTTYLRGVFLGLPAIYLVNVIDSLFRARGTTVVPLLMQIVGVAVNLALNAVAVLVLEWGVAGIAVATIGSRVAASALGLVLIARGGLRLRVPLLPPARPDAASYRRMLRIGFPAGMRPFLFAAIFMVVSGFVSRIGGVEALGGLTVGIRIEGLCFLLMLGFGLSVAPAVGQNLGAGDTRRAEHAAWAGAGFAAIAGLVVGGLFLLIPRELMSLLSRDPGIQEMGAVYLRIVSVCQIFTALEIAFGQAFTGAGDTVPPLIISTTFTVLRVPGAWLFGDVLGGGILAIWWVINLTAIARGIGMCAWFLRGRWKRRAVT
jgi:putative MATE family efflux protein